MNPVHLHLMLNHVPVIGTALTLALLALALWKKSEELKHAALLFLVGVALVSVPAYLTGESAEESLMDVAGVEETFIAPHEDAAQWAFGGQIALGVVALAGLVVFRGGKYMPGKFTGAVFAMALAVSGLMARTAYLGGQIRHPEIRTGPAPAALTHNQHD